MKSIFILLLTLHLLYCSTITSETTSKSAESSTEETIPVIKTQEEIDAMKAANVKADALFNDKATKEGRDDPDGVVEERQLIVKQVPSDAMPNQVGEIDQNPKMKTIRVNKFTISVADKDLSYRGIEAAVSLVELVKGSDDPSTGRCCSGIGDTNMEKIDYTSEGIVKSKTLHCFKIDGEFESFKFCSANPLEIYEFRLHLVLATMKAELRRKGVTNLNVLLPGGGAPLAWSWNDQEPWGPLCNLGKAQSPIDIGAGSTRKVAFMSLAFKFKKSDSPTVIFDGHEINVKGDFGSLIHKLEVGQRDFMIEKLKFKFPSEHLIDGTQSDGEMLLYLKSKDGLIGIASFLFEADNEGGAQWNTFLDELNIEKWDLGSEDGLTLKSQPNLDNLVVGKEGGQIKYQARHIFRRSFYWYTGSDSVPPCNEEVYRFVFSQPIYVPAAQLHFLKEKSFLNELEIGGNKKLV